LALIVLECEYPFGSCDGYFCAVPASVSTSVRIGAYPELIGYHRFSQLK
jgi:hypothetical protein